MKHIKIDHDQFGYNVNETNIYQVKCAIDIEVDDTRKIIKKAVQYKFNVDIPAQFWNNIIIKLSGRKWAITSKFSIEDFHEKNIQL